MSIRKRKRLETIADELADQLADKPYGKAVEDNNEKEFVVTSISIHKSTLYRLEDLVLLNKRQGIEPKNVSALIRKAIDKLLTTS